MLRQHRHFAKIIALFALIGLLALTLPSKLSLAHSAVAQSEDGATSTEQCNPDKDLSGWFSSNSRGVIQNESATCSYDVGIASYEKYDEIIDHQIHFDSTTTTINPNQKLYLDVGLPNCAAQIDIFYGPVLFSLDGQRYGTRLLSARHIGGTNYCTWATPTTYPTPTEPTATTITPTEPTATTVTPTEPTTTTVTPTQPTTTVTITPTATEPTATTVTPTATATEPTATTVTPTQTNTPTSTSTAPSLRSVLSSLVKTVPRRGIPYQTLVEKPDGLAGFVRPGYIIQYTITVENFGGSPATSVSVIDAMSTATTYTGVSTIPPTLYPSLNQLYWNVGTIPPGGTWQVTFEVVVDNDITGVYTLISNTGFTYSSVGNFSTNTITYLYDPAITP